MRFSCGRDHISVVAGLSGSEMLATGLKDIWLYATSRDLALSSDEMFSGMRLRCIETPTNMLPDAVEKLNQSLSLDFALTFISWPELRGAELLFFAYGLISDGSMADHPFGAAVSEVRQEIS
jgi:hypothetical protein